MTVVLVRITFQCFFHTQMTTCLLVFCSVKWRVRCAVDDPGDIGHYYYGPGHPMKPHRLKLAHHLLLAYNLYREMDVYRPHLASSTVRRRYSYFLVPSFPPPLPGPFLNVFAVRISAKAFYLGLRVLAVILLPGCCGGLVLLLNLPFFMRDSWFRDLQRKYIEFSI